MADYENEFERELSKANIIIQKKFKVKAFVTRLGDFIYGIFDNPDETIETKARGKTENTQPTLEVFTTFAIALKKKDQLIIKEQSYWIDEIGPDNLEYSLIKLQVGIPSQESPPLKGWSKK